MAGGLLTARLAELAVPGVYAIKDCTGWVYVGQSANILLRITDRAHPAFPWLGSPTATLQFHPEPDPVLRLYRESRWLRWLRPRLNAYLPASRRGTRLTRRDLRRRRGRHADPLPEFDELVRQLRGGKRGPYRSKRRLQALFAV